jgi:hypothetical protein
MDEIALPTTNQLYTIIGGHEASIRLLELSARITGCGKLLILDCGNRANPLPIVRELRRLTDDPIAAIGNIRTARAFTCYQVLALLQQLEQRTTPVQNPVILFDLLASFYDESVNFREGLRLLDLTLKSLARVRSIAPLLVSARPPFADFPERKTFVDMLLGISDQYWIEEPAAQPQEQQFRLFA